MSVKNVFDKIISFENLLNAEKEVGSGTKGKKPEVLIFRDDLEANLFYLQECMENLKPPEPRYNIFYVYEPKLRKIVDIDYKNKIIQRAIYDVINPLICKGFITDTYSCIKGRGQLSAMQRLYNWERHIARKEGQWYYLKLDAAKFFYRIEHIKLCEIIDKKIGDRKATALIKYYVCNSDIPFGLPIEADPKTIFLEDMLWDVGIAIGGGLSHMLGNMYLDSLDQFCKRELGIHYYIRYMDDIAILSDNKAQLHEWKRVIQDFLNQELHLALNNKTAIRPLNQGIEFVGYRIWPTHVTLRKGTSLRMKRRLRYLKEQYADYKITFEKVTETVSSYKALMKHCDCYGLEKKILEDLVLTHHKE